jgi:hypothetical protein
VIKTFVNAIRREWKTCKDVEQSLDKYLNMNKGQITFFRGQREEVILSMATEILKEQGVTARSIEDPIFEEMAEAIRNTEEVKVIPKRRRRTQK